MPSNTPVTQALEPVEVTQADRDAAAKFAGTCTKYSFVWTEAPAIQRGEHDEWEIVQAFARHRQSSSNAGGVNVPLLELVAGYADYKAISDDRWEQGKAAGYRELGEMVSASLASLSTPTAEPMGDALTPSALSGGEAATLPADHPLARGLRTSQKALDAIARQEQANIAGYLALRDFPIGSALSGDAGEGR